MKTHFCIALIAAAVALGGCNPKPPPEAHVVSPHEAAPVLSSPPTTAKAGAPLPSCAQNFTVFDTNGDQRVSRREFLERPHAHPDPEAVFQTRDGDVDESLTGDEFCSGWDGRARAGRGMGTGRGPGMGAGGGPGMGQGKGLHCEGHFTRFDTNGDSNVSEVEFAALPHPHGDARAIFIARDQNHDGLLTQSEFCAPWSVAKQDSPAKTP